MNICLETQLILIHAVKKNLSTTSSIYSAVNQDS